MRHDEKTIVYKLKALTLTGDSFEMEINQASLGSIKLNGRDVRCTGFVLRSTPGTQPELHMGFLLPVFTDELPKPPPPSETECVVL